MSTKKASQEALHGLHALLAKAFTSIIEEGVVVMDKQGEAVKLTAPASFFKEAREFLKDNGVEALPSANAGLKSLAEVLPFPEAGDEADVRRG